MTNHPSPTHVSAPATLWHMLIFSPNAVAIKDSPSDQSLSMCLLCHRRLSSGASVLPPSTIELLWLPVPDYGTLFPQNLMSAPSLTVFWKPSRVGGVAQWLGRRSVAGGLYLIYAWSMVDVWPLCG